VGEEEIGGVGAVGTEKEEASNLRSDLFFPREKERSSTSIWARTLFGIPEGHSSVREGLLE